MQYERLLKLNSEIINTRQCEEHTPPVINELRRSQKYLIVSSDPSSDTDKTKSILERHSSFEERIISLVFLGSDDQTSLEKIRSNYSEYKDKFLDSFYWTHYSKCYSAGNPDSFWADRFLRREIELFEPELIIIFGSKPADFLFGRAKLKERVNKVLEWEGIPVICSLHPSRDWNVQRRREYSFEATWVLIRSKIKLD
ncbi:MAG: uracil-DNA glycosylase family protein [Patescibacteria group bacterium]